MYLDRNKKTLTYNQKIYLVNALCGAGKTFQALRFVYERASTSKEKYLIVQPSKELIDQSYDDLCKLDKKYRSPMTRIRIERIHGGTHDFPVSTITDYLMEVQRAGQVLFITHSAFLKLRYFHKPEDWNVIVDEIPNPVAMFSRNIPRTHFLITKHIVLSETNDHGFMIVEENGCILDEYRKNPGRDDVYTLFREFAETVTHDHWNVQIHKDVADKYCYPKKKGRPGTSKFEAYSELRPSIFSEFQTVTIMGANFYDSLLYNLWSDRVDFQPHRFIGQGGYEFRFDEHDGSKLNIITLNDDKWSKYLKNKSVKGVNLKKLISDIVKNIIGDLKFIYVDNNDVEDELLSTKLSTRLNHSPHGLNKYQHVNAVAFLSAQNPSPSYSRWLESLGLSKEVICRAWSYQTVYQAAMRSSLRNPDNKEKKTIVVADFDMACYLEEIFPGSYAELREDILDIIKSTKKKRGRPVGTKKPNSLTNAEKQRNYRLRMKKSRKKSTS